MTRECRHWIEFWEKDFVFGTCVYCGKRFDINFRRKKDA